MTAVSDLMHQVPPAAAYGVLAAAVLLESVFLVGTLAPTLTLLLTAGALARTGDLSLAVAVAVAAGSAIAGDALAHRTGRVFGPRLRTGRFGRRIPAAAWHRAHRTMSRHGGTAVALCRFLPVLRTLTPHVAGQSGLPYRRIAPYSAAAALAWAALEAGAGYTLAASAQHLSSFVGPALAGAVALLALCVHARRRRCGIEGPTAVAVEVGGEMLQPLGPASSVRTSWRPGIAPDHPTRRHRGHCRRSLGDPHRRESRGADYANQAEPLPALNDRPAGRGPPLPGRPRPRRRSHVRRGRRAGDARRGLQARRVTPAITTPAQGLRPDLLGGRIDLAESEFRDLCKHEMERTIHGLKA